MCKCLSKSVTSPIIKHPVKFWFWIVPSRLVTILRLLKIPERWALGEQSPRCRPLKVIAWPRFFATLCSLVCRDVNSPNSSTTNWSSPPSLPTPWKHKPKMNPSSQELLLSGPLTTTTLKCCDNSDWSHCPLKQKMSLATLSRWYVT